ncbi:MAG: asparagine--tRNA ligase [Candidatus Micrarchaeia archaeon]
MYSDISQIFIDKLDGKEVTVRGWVYRHRVSGNMAFAVIRDATGIIQATIKKDKVDEKGWKDSSEAYVESSVIISGTVKKDERAPGGYELQVSRFETVWRGEPFPIAKDLSEEFLLDVRHLWMRSQKLSNIMKARHHITNYLREFFDKEGFWEIAPPMITRSGCEGGSTLFEMNYFGEKAYLTQSSQMYAEVFVFSLGKVFVLAPSFRAEKSRTIRHLAEYWHLEPEMAWYDQKMNMEVQENMVEYAVQKMVKEHPDLLKACGRDPETLAKVVVPFPRMDYAKAIERVNELAGSEKMKFGDDFGADEEAILTKEYEVPLFVHNFPKEIKAFYMREDPNKPGTVLNADLLAPAGHGEMIGGSERIWKLDELEARMKEQNLNIKDYQWYVDLRKYGSVPHSGYGLGIERFVKWMLNLDHIRDTIPFPRTINRCYP